MVRNFRIHLDVVAGVVAVCNEVALLGYTWGDELVIRVVSFLRLPYGGHQIDGQMWRLGPSLAPPRLSPTLWENGDMRRGKISGL